MKLDNHKPLIPKKKRGALNQAVQCLLQIERNSKRKENVMKHRTDVKTKIEKLQEELIRIQNNIEELDKDSDSYQRRLSLLKTQFELTDLEISKQKLESLERNLKQIEALKQAGLKELPPTFTE